MHDVPVKILGISATGIIDGNCDNVMKVALKTAAGFDQVETEFITLADKEIMTCTHCQWCIENAKPCKYEDDATWILQKMEKADGFIWGAPVWSHPIPPHVQGKPPVDDWPPRTYPCTNPSVQQNHSGNPPSTSRW